MIIFRFLKLNISIRNFAWLLVATLVIGCGGGAPSEEEVRRETIYRDFNVAHQWFVRSTKGGWTNEDNGRFANDDAPAMEAMYLLYANTRDPRYAEMAYAYGQKIIAAGDDVMKRVDVRRGNRMLPGWSSTRYTVDKSRTQFLLNSAIIASQLVQGNRLLKGSAQSALAPDSWLSYSERVFNEVFVPDWKQVSPTSGYFEDSYFPEVSKIRMPVNQYVMAGNFALELYKSTNNSRYLQYATQTANYLRSELILRNGAYLWCYSKYVADNQCTSLDDFSHAQYVLKFMLNMGNAGVNFTSVEMERIGGTFNTHLVGPGGIYFYLGGYPYLAPSGNPPYKQNPWLHYFIDLLGSSNANRAYFENYLKSWVIQYDPASDFNHIGEFALLHYALSVKYFGQNHCKACLGS